MGKQETVQHLGPAAGLLPLLFLDLKRDWEGAVSQERETCEEKVPNKRQELGLTVLGPTQSTLSPPQEANQGNKYLNFTFT